ncbi:MAG TPA: hypothetical protein VN606_08350 [Thermoleophilaceae bacterium]|nr:hypothetical protein [Thermoleophilaceae bacterium]
MSPVRLRVHVFLNRWSLDHRLALGERPDFDPALALRAQQLMRDKTRRSLARLLRRDIRLAFEPCRWGSSSPLDRHAVADAAPLIDGIARRLTAPTPVGVRGIALISDMLGDGASPLYDAGWTSQPTAGALTNRLHSADRALELAL